MPELPEVETMRRGILHLQGCRIQDADRAPCACRPILIRPRIDVLRRRLSGRRIVAVERMGKRVVLRTEGQLRLVFEPRMTGLVLVADPPSVEHLRFRLDVDSPRSPHLWYWDRRGLGSVQLLDEAEAAQRLGPGQLGPDALDVQLAQLREALGTVRREIKVALLDQKRLAGVGNLYASELLHRARVHPQRRCETLTAAQWRRIHAALLQVLAEAVEHEGSTLSDGTYRNALNQSGAYQNHHAVYDREGERCQVCRRGRIRRIVQSQRATFFCPRCQRQ